MRSASNRAKGAEAERDSFQYELEEKQNEVEKLQSTVEKFEDEESEPQREVVRLTEETNG